MALSAQKAEDKMRAYQEALKFFGVIAEMIDPLKRKEIADELAEAFAVPEGLKKQAADAHAVIAKAEDHKTAINKQCDDFEKYADMKTAEIDKKAAELKEYESGLNQKHAELVSYSDSQTDKDKSLVIRETQVNEKIKQIAAVEKAHDNREYALDTRESAIKATEQLLSDREKAVAAREKTFIEAAKKIAG